MNPSNNWSLNQSEPHTVRRLNAFVSNREFQKQALGGVILSRIDLLQPVCQIESIGPKVACSHRGITSTSIARVTNF